MTSNDKATSTLNDLIETAKDGQKGYSEAAEGVKDPDLRALFMQYSNQRAQIASELQSQVKALGAEPEKKGSAAGALHRGWIDLKAAITGRDDLAILNECERGEDIAKETFEKAIKGTDLSGTILPMVQRHYAQVQEAHDRIRDLRNDYRAREKAA